MSLSPEDLSILSREKSLNRLIGSGAKFPFIFSSKGSVKSVELSHGPAKINQSIHHILSTRKGERVHRPTFGSNVHKLVFEPNDTILWAQLKFEVAVALRDWEPRIDLITVSPVPATSMSFTGMEPIGGASEINQLTNQNSIGIFIKYVIKRTHELGSYVYPFVREPMPLNENLELRGDFWSTD